jgi:heterodisulfide reductase subunit A-like polyferredoxin
LVKEDLRIGVFVCDCGSNIAGFLDTEEVREFAENLPDVVVSVRNKYTCADPGQQEIQRAIFENRLNRIVVASCSPSSYEPIFRQCIQGAGLNPYLLEMANIREHCSWVTPDTGPATAKAKDIVKVAVTRRMKSKSRSPMRLWLSAVAWPVCRQRWIWPMRGIRYIWLKKSRRLAVSWRSWTKSTRILNAVSEFWAPK